MGSTKTYTASAAQNEPIEIGWLVAARVCLLCVVLLWAALSSLSGAEYIIEGQGAVFSFVGICFGLTALSGLWLKWKKPGFVFVGLQLAFDLLIVTGIIYLTGGPASPFLFLYLPLVMAASIIIKQSAALLLSVAGSCCYSLLAVAMVQGWIPAADGTAFVLAPSWGLLPQIMGLSSAMILIAVATSFLTRKINRSNYLAEQSIKELQEMDNSQRMLLDSIPEGIITIEPNGNISSINETAAKLLQISNSDVKGLPMARLLKKLNPSLDFSENSNIPASGELEIMNPGSSRAARLSYQTCPLFTSNGKESGRAFVFQDVTQLRSIEGQLKLQEKMARLLSQNESQHGDVTGPPELIGESPLMKKVFNLISRVATSNATILINGESGTGKELTAKAIHKQSERSGKPFVAVNCGAIPENLIESELFGHKKGSFTGADTDRKGLFREADTGTIFLDEIGELPLHMQAKLLRVLQEKTVRPIGADRDISIDARVIAATNRNLKAEIDAERFREDLYYRLNVININLPSLRARKEDIPVLMQAILKRISNCKEGAVISPAAMQLLLNYDYPGNVRELENILERALVLSAEAILPEHLPAAVRSSEQHQKVDSCETQIIIDESITFPVKLDDILASIEQRYLENALTQTGGAKKEAARLLGINFRSFRYRLQKFEVEAES